VRGGGRSEGFWREGLVGVASGAREGLMGVPSGAPDDLFGHGVRAMVFELQCYGCNVRVV
jgi:hypothetical protein